MSTRSGLKENQKDCQEQSRNSSRASQEMSSLNMRSSQRPFVLQVTDQDMIWNALKAMDLKRAVEMFDRWMRGQIKSGHEKSLEEVREEFLNLLDDCSIHLYQERL